MSAYLALGLAFLAGAVFGWATALWVRICAEEKRQKAEGEEAERRALTQEAARSYPAGVSSVLLRGVRFDKGGLHHPEPPAFHTACSRRRFGSGCVPFVEPPSTPE